MIINTIVAGDMFIARLERAPLAYRAALALQMDDVAEYLYGAVRYNLLGGVLQTRSGQLADAVQRDVIENGDRITARVWIEGVPYARIQERGGVTAPHEIYPREAKALRFEWGEAGLVFFAHVNHPGSRIPESMYMRKVLIDEGATVRSMIRNAVRQAKSS